MAFRLKLLNLAWDLQVRPHTTLEDIIISHAETVEVIIINLHTFVTNRFIIIGSKFKIFNKVPDDVIFP